MRRSTYIVQKGDLVVQRRSRRVVLLGHDTPRIFTRKREAEWAAHHAGGWVVRLRPNAKAPPGPGWPWNA